MNTAATTFPIAGFARECGFAPDAEHALALASIAGRLRQLPSENRKLLAHAAALAFGEHSLPREAAVAYLPELHETCGLGVDEMYEQLRRLEQAGFVHLRGDYPFQEVEVADAAPLGWPWLRDLVRFCAARRLSLRELIADLRFDLLG